MLFFLKHRIRNVHQSTEQTVTVQMFLSVNVIYQNCIQEEGPKYRKGKGHPTTAHEVPEGEQMYSSTLQPRR